MAVGQLSVESSAIAASVRRTVALVRRRGYALGPSRLGELCLGGSIPESEVRRAVATERELALVEGLVVERVAAGPVPAIRARAGGHPASSAWYLHTTRAFRRR